MRSGEPIFEGAMNRARTMLERMEASNERLPIEARDLYCSAKERYPDADLEKLDLV